ncbi:MAG: hypothetical protein O3A20_05230 [Planctomycetota bacterium]|nr:hypothetical protein [Planctomycetota bacterium]
MSAALLLAAVLCQHPFGEPPQEVLRGDPDAALLGGAWRMLGPIAERGRSAGGSALSHKHQSAMKPGEPWPALDEPFETQDGVRRLWRDVDLGLVADSRATELILPRLREGFETGQVDLDRIPILDTDDEPRIALFYRTIHARERAKWFVELRHQGAIRLWLNGSAAMESGESSANVPRNITLEFAPGLNHMVIETTSPPSGGWGFELRHRHALTETAVNRSIGAGARFLLSRQQADGSWAEYGNFPSGVTALALLALLKSDLPRSHSAALRALDSLRRHPPHQTYSLALALLAVHAFGDPAHDAWIEEMAGDLIEWQNGNGLWGYPDGGGDLSNTQFAALALHAAAQRGIEIPKGTWRDLVNATLACRESGGSGVARGRAAGFGYAFNGGSYASMTAAGVGTLQICGVHLGEDLNRRARTAVDAGIEWLGENCPLHAQLGSGDTWTTYMLYGLERAGALTHNERFGTHPWYAEGAAWLLERQRGNGAWVTGSGSDVDTSFALLFLTRATAKSAVTQPGGDNGAGRLFVTSVSDGPLIMRAALGPTLDLWVDTQSPEFTRIARVVYWLRAPGGDWKTVDSSASKRFDARVRLDRPGVWEARASAFLHDGSSRGSGTLEIPHEVAHAQTTPMAGLTEDPDANLLRGGMCEAVASSTLTGTRADGICDQRSASRWLCAQDDSEPWIEIQLKRRVKGCTLVLRPCAWLPSDAEEQPDPSRVRVSVNGGNPRVVELSEAVPARWTVDLGRTEEIRKIRIEILAVHRGQLGACSVGFGEVEVHEAAPGQE